MHTAIKNILDIMNQLFTNKTKRYQCNKFGNVLRMEKPVKVEAKY